jgi:hypothetical protein
VRDRKAEARLIKLKERCKAAGKEWVEPTEYQQHKEEQRRAMLYPTTQEAADELAARPPLEIIERNLDALAAHKLTKEEQIERMRFIDSLFAPRFDVRFKYKATYDQAHYDMMEDKGGECFFCKLCSKECWGGRSATHDAHTRSTEHIRRLTERAAANEMAGRAVSARRFEASCSGLPGALTLHRFRRFWGEHVEEMPQLVWSALRKGATMTVDMPMWSKKAKKTLTCDDIQDLQFGAVAYAGGQGKYSENQEFIPFERFERLIDPDEETDMSKCMHAPTGKGFWPVCKVTWRNMHLDHGFRTAEEYDRAVRSGRCKAYVVCWYQLVDDGRVLYVWAIIYLNE